MEKLYSPNYFVPSDMTESAVLAVVEHGTAAPDFRSAINWHLSRKSKLSANFHVSKLGEIAQLVDFQRGYRAWANGVVDKENFDRSVPWLADLVAREINPNWHTVSIEHEATSYEMLHQAPMTDAQFNASIELTAWILQVSGLKANHSTVLAHRQIAGAMKPTCPGVIFVPAYLEVLVNRHPELRG